MILVFSPSISAWYDKTHIFILVEAVNLLKRIDQERNSPEYMEVYSDKYMRRLFTGASDEDWYPAVRGNERAFRHFYNPDSTNPTKGLKFYRHFYMWGPVQGAKVKAPSGGYYEGTLKWVMDPNTGNIHNWPGAICAYDYTESSKQEAYYRLGHVGHLLGDMAEADHSGNAPHGGSGFTIPEDLELMIGPKVWEKIDNLQVVSLRTKKLIKTTLSNLYSIMKHQLIEEGQQYTSYERLIEDHVDLSLVKDYMTEEEIGKRVHDSRFDNPPQPPISGENIRKFSKVDDFFNTMSRKSRAAVASAGFRVPLLLADLGKYIAAMASFSPTGAVLSFFLYEPVDIIPTLDIRDTVTESQYLEFTWPLIKEAVEHNAGLLEHFFDVVNHPPYVQEISIRQEGSTGRYHANWKADLAERIVGWKDFKYKIVNARKMESEGKPFHDGDPIEITVAFGPHDDNGAKQIDPNTVWVTVGGTQVPGRVIDGYIWKGYYFPEEMDEDANKKTLSIEISARDMHHHHPRDGFPDFGYELDSIPQTPAKAHFTPPYKWNGYENGPDLNHAIEIEPEEEEEEEEPEEEEMEEDPDRVYPENPPPAVKYFVFSRQCGDGAKRIHVGTEDEFKSKVRCKDEWLFGISSEYVTASKLSGPFNTKEQAVEAGCGLISEPHYRNILGWGQVPYAKMGGGLVLIDSDLAGACIQED